MVRLCSKSSRSYSGRPAVLPHRQRRERRSAMAIVGLQESAEAVVPRATSREHPDGLTTREGLNLAGRHDHRWSCSGSDRKPIGPATGSDHRGRERVLRHSARIFRNRRTRTGMYGGVGAGRGNSPGDPIRRHDLHGQTLYDQKQSGKREDRSST